MLLLFSQVLFLCEAGEQSAQSAGSQQEHSLGFAAAAPAQAASLACCCRCGRLSVERIFLPADASTFYSLPPPLIQLPLAADDFAKLLLF